MSRKEILIGIFLTVCGVILHSTKAVIVKLAYLEGISSGTVLLWRMLFSLPLYLMIGIYHFKKEKPGNIQPKTLMYMVGLGFIGYYLSSFFDFKGLEYIDASLERLVLFTYPTITYLLIAFINKSGFKQKDIISIMVTYVGIGLVFYSKIGQQDDLMLGVGYIFLCALTYAFYLVGSNFLVKDVGTIFFTIISMLSSTVFVIIHYLLIGDGQAFELSSKLYVLLITMAVFSTVLPSFMIVEGIRRLGAAKVGIISSLGPVSTITLSIFFLGEVLTPIQYIGGAVVVGGVYFLTKK